MFLALLMILFLFFFQAINKMYGSFVKQGPPTPREHWNIISFISMIYSINNLTKIYILFFTTYHLIDSEFVISIAMNQLISKFRMF